MKLYMEQKIFSLGVKHNVFTATGEVAYRVEGEVFSFGQKLHLYQEGTEVGYVEQQLFHLRPHYAVYVRGKWAAEVVRSITFFQPHYEIRGLHWQVTGEVFEHEYEVRNAAGTPLFYLKKGWMTFGDCYELSFADSLDPVLALALAVAIDAVDHSK